MQTPMDWQGKMLGRYRLLSLLGRGGMGEVWLADDTQLRRQVAIKLLPAVYSEDHNYLRAFMQEARTAASLEHPHILPVHDFGEERIAGDEVVTYLVMPHISGGSLRERLRSIQGPIPMTEGIRYLRQAAQAIDYAHSKQVLHRDIKPANMLIQNDWLLLADFGISKILNETKQSRTHAGAGTPEYIAPEQAQSRAVAASDLYSLAIISYQMLTGSVPFRGATPYDTLIAHITTAPEPLRSRIPTIAPSVEAVVLRGLAKQPEQRQASCVAFVDELEQALRNSNTLSAVHAQPTPSTPLTPLSPATDPDATVLAPWSKRSHPLEPVQPQPFPTPSAHQSAPSQSGLPTIQSTPEGAHAQVAQPYPATQPAAPGPYPPYQGPTTQPPYQGPFTAPTPLNGSGFSHPQFPGMLSSAPTSQDQERKKPTLGRRQLIIGGVVGAAIVIAGGATAATLLHRGSDQTGGPQPTPTPRIGPQQFQKGIPLLVLSAHNGSVDALSWHKSGRYLITAGGDGNVILWDIASYLQKSSTLQTISTPLNKWRLSGGTYRKAMDWADDGVLFAVIHNDENFTVQVFDPFGKKSSFTPYQDKKNSGEFDKIDFSAVAWSPTEKIFAAATFFKGTIELFDTKRSTEPAYVFTNPEQSKTQTPYELSAPAWSKDGKYLAGQSANFKTIVWDVKSKQIKQKLELPSRSNKSVVIAEDALGWSPTEPEKLAMLDLDAVCVWDALQNKLLMTLGTDDPAPLTLPPDPPQGWVPHLISLTWSSNGRYIAGGYARSNRVYVWDTQNLVASKTKDNMHVQNFYFGDEGHKNALSNLAWSPDGRYIATTSSDRTCIVWKVDGAK